MRKQFPLLLLLLLLLGAILERSRAIHEASEGLDLYHFWVIQAVRSSGGESFGSPYREADRYARVMNRRAEALWDEWGVTPRHLDAAHRDRSGRGYQQLRAMASVRAPHQWRFLAANLYRRELDLTATPLLYASFAFLPLDYEAASRLYLALQYLAFFAAAALLWRLAAGRWLPALLLAATLCVAFTPLERELMTGNVNAVHLLIAALALGIACGPLRSARDARTRIRWGALMLALAAAFTLLKPSFALLALALLAHLWVLAGRAVCLRALAGGALAAVALITLPALTYGSAGVWRDWFERILGGGAARIIYPIAEGNCSTTLLLSDWTGGVSLRLIAPAVVLLLLGSLAAALCRGRGWRLRAAELARDPLAMASLAVLLSLAASPLVWTHYLVFTLIPIAWLAGREPRTLQAATGALVALALLLYAGILFWALAWLEIEGLEIEWLESPSAGVAVLALAWIPLWIAGIMRIGAADPS